MRKLALMTGVSLMALGLGLGQAHAAKGIFEAPMMESVGEVDGSEGKITRLGEYKVEVPSVDADGHYTVCLNHDDGLNGGAEEDFLETQFLMGGDELKAEGTTDLDDFYGPEFRVYFSAGTSGASAPTDCGSAGPLVYRSGMSPLVP